MEDSGHSHDHCRFLNLDRLYSPDDLAAFHGHLGPFIVLGYRIGRYVREHFCSDPFRMKAFVHCSGITPESCLADGVQLGSGCTLGKRNIRIVRDKDIRCEFQSEGKQITIVPRPFDLPPRDEHYERTIEHYAEELYYKPEAELFEIRSGA